MSNRLSVFGFWEAAREKRKRWIKWNVCENAVFFSDMRVSTLSCSSALETNDVKSLVWWSAFSSMIYINVSDWMSHNRGSATDDEQGFIFRKVESLNLLYMYQLCYSFFFLFQILRMFFQRNALLTPHPDCDLPVENHILVHKAELKISDCTQLENLAL